MEPKFLHFVSNALDRSHRWRTHSLGPRNISPPSGANFVAALSLSREEILPVVRIPADIPARCSSAGYAE